MKLLKKTALALFTVCVLAICTVLCAANVSAAKVTASGECGDNVTWTLYDDGELVIEGEGDMWDWSETNAPWFSQYDKITSAMIKEGVTSIGNSAFQYCSITSVNIPESITTIGDYAFDSCAMLTNITIPYGVTSIGNCAFSICITLENVTIPNSVTEIGSSAFGACNAFTNITIPESVATIGSGAFGACPALSNVTILSRDAEFGRLVFDSNTTLHGYANSTTEAYAAENGINFAALDPENVEPAETDEPEETDEWDNFVPYVYGKCGDNLKWTLYHYIFDEKVDNILVIEGEGDMWDLADEATWAPWHTYRGRISSVIIKEGVTSIGNFAFSSCNYLYGVTIPESVTSIGIGAFFSCSNLTSVTIPNSVTSIGVGAFNGCSDLSSVIIQHGVKEIGAHAFGFCFKLTDITLPDSVVSIGDGAFHYCIGLTNITISDNVTSIGDNAISFCDSLTSINIPDSVTSIGDKAFYACDSLSTISVAENNPNYCDVDGVLFNKDQTKLIQYPHNKDATEYSIPEGVTTIDKVAFYHCAALTSITIPESVTEISDGAFAFCHQLKKATVLSRNAEFGEDVFLELSADFILYGYAGSTTEAYAAKYNLLFGNIETGKVEVPEKPKISNAYTYYGEITYTGVQAPQVADNSIVGEIIGGGNTKENYQFEKAFDNNMSTWWDGADEIWNMWVGIKTEKPMVATSFTIATQDNDGDGISDRRHAMWGSRLQGSNNGITWTNLYVYKYADFESYTNDKESTYLTIAFENDTAYTYYRYLNNNDGANAVAEVQIFGRYADEVYNYHGEITYTGLQAPAVAANSIVGEIIGGAATKDGNEFDKAFDGVLNTWWNGSGAIYDMWVGIKTEAPVVATSFTIATQDNDGDGVSDRRHAMWGSRLQGSNDGITWNDLYVYEYADFESYTNDTESTYLTISFENETAYTYFRYLNNDEGANALAELQLYSSANATALPGDLNEDDSVDISDALLLFMHSMLPEQYPIADSINVDFNKDGSIDIADALLLFMHSMLPELYPL